MDPFLPVEVRSFDELLGASMARDRLSVVLLGMFGAAALLLAGVGIYGVMAYAVVQRTGEIAIREALGAAPPDIRSLILREGLLLGVIGVVAGLAIAAVASRWVSSQLYGVSALDPAVFLVVPLVLLGIVLVASTVPALRAMRVDPVTMLRSE
jgi:putative ABC transport system permease protein